MTNEEQLNSDKQEKENEERVQALRVKAYELAQSLPDDPEVRADLSKLQGDPKSIQQQELEQIARRIKEKEAQQTQQTIMKGALTLAGLGVLAGIGNQLLADGNQLASNEVAYDGDYHPAQTGAGAPGFPPLPKYVENLPIREQQGQQIHLNSRF